MTEKRALPTYGQYLKLDALLGCQEPVTANLDSSGGAHDELLFIIVHQTYELWFKQILHEVSSVVSMFDNNHVDEENIGTAVSRLSRVVQIEKLMIEQIKVLETMTPLDFLDFRNELTGASGFQSVQFRLVENLLGLPPRQRLRYGNRVYHADYSEDERAKVRSSESGPTLFSVVERWLERTPFVQFGSFSFVQSYIQAFRRMLDTEKQAIDAASHLSAEEKQLRIRMSKSTEQSVLGMMDESGYQNLVEQKAVRLSYRAFLAALFINLYRDQPILAMPYRLLSTLLEMDEYLTLWRYRHSLMVLRMIGSKMGTGGSTGHDYLKATVDKHRIFVDLFSLSTLLIPRSELPPLPSELQSNLKFHYTVTEDRAQ